MYCKNCGAEAQPEDKFCFSCGAALKEEQAAETVKKKRFPWLLLIIAVALIAAIIIALVVIRASGRKEREYEEQLKLAERYLDELDYDRAIAAYKAAIDIDPENPEAYLALADTYIEIGDYEAARKILEKGLRRTGDEEFEDRLKELEELISEVEGEEEIEALPTPTPVPDSRDIYEEFLRGERKARVDKSSPSYCYGTMSDEFGLTDYMPAYEMTFSDFLEFYKEFNEELYQMPGFFSIDLNKVRYAYIDLGNDGSEEMVVTFDHGWEKGTTELEFFVREKEGELEIFTMHESMARGWCGISNRYGRFGGGGSGGASHGSGEAGYLDAEGRYTCIYDASVEYDLRSVLHDEGSWYNNALAFDNDAVLYEYRSPNYMDRNYLHSNDDSQRENLEDDWAVYNKYIGAFRRYGVDLSTPDTEEDYINQCYKAAGCPDEVRNGPEIEWLNYSDL